MERIFPYIFVAGIFFYYLGVLVFTTRLAIRSGRLKHFRDVTPDDIALLFDGLDGNGRRIKRKGGSHA